MHRPVFGCAALALVLSMPAPAPAKSPSNDEMEIQRFTLTSPFLDKMAAVQRKVATLEKDHPEMEKQMKGAASKNREETDNSIDGMVKKMDSFPPLVNIIKAQGLTVRQYVVGTMALIQAGMYAAMKKQMPSMKTPEGMNMANVAFIEAHQAELDKFQKSMKSMNAAAGHKKQKSDPEGEQEEKKDEEQ